MRYHHFCAGGSPSYTHGQEVLCLSQKTAPKSTKTLFPADSWLQLSCRLLATQYNVQILSLQADGDGYLLEWSLPTTATMYQQDMCALWERLFKWRIYGRCSCMLHGIHTQHTFNIWSWLIDYFLCSTKKEYRSKLPVFYTSDTQEWGEPISMQREMHSLRLWQFLSFIRNPKCNPAENEACVSRTSFRNASSKAALPLRGQFEKTGICLTLWCGFAFTWRTAVSSTPHCRNISSSSLVYAWYLTGKNWRAFQVDPVPECWAPSGGRFKDVEVPTHPPVGLNQSHHCFSLTIPEPAGEMKHLKRHWHQLQSLQLKYRVSVASSGIAVSTQRRCDAFLFDLTTHDHGGRTLDV